MKIGTANYEMVRAAHDKGIATAYEIFRNGVPVGYSLGDLGSARSATRSIARENGDAA